MNFNFTHFYLFIMLIVIIISSNCFSVYAGDEPQKKPEINVIGGQNADIKDYPWQVVIYAVDTTGYLYQLMCGGTIIDPYWILTAAHCVNEKSYFNQKIVAEVTNRHKTSEGQVMEISDCIIHPAFNNINMNNDIALLRLSYPIDTSKLGASVINVMSSNEEMDGLIDPGIIGTITGWGDSSSNTGQNPEILKSAEIPIVANDTANLWYSQSHPGRAQIISSMMAAGLLEGGVGGCYGDSGGPFVVKDDSDNWILAGITSWGDTCGVPKQPTVFTRVPFFYDWIINNSRIGLNENPVVPDKVDILRINIKNRIDYCVGNLFFGDFLIRNFGTDTLKNIELKVNIYNSNNEIIYRDTSTIKFDPPLPFNATKRINLSADLPYSPGNLNFELICGKPNGNTNIPDTVSEKRQFSFEKLAEFKLDFNFMDIQNIHWDIRDLIGDTTVISGSYESNNSNKSITEYICLHNSNYEIGIAGEGNGNFNFQINSDEKYYSIAASNNFIFNKAEFSVPFEIQNDLGIKIISPVTSDSIYFCENDSLTLYNQITISNKGTVLADNIRLKIIINNNIIDTLINKNIFPGKTNTLFWKLNNFNAGKNLLSAEITNYGNFSSDINSSNNKSEISFDYLAAGKIAEMEMTSDESFNFYSWEIKNSNNEILIHDYALDEGSYNTDICIPPGCYKFFPINYAGNGIPVDTAVILKDMNGEILLTITGDQFYTTNNFDFCAGITGIEEQRPEEIKIYPNPANEQLFLGNVPHNSMIAIYDIIGNKQFEEKLTEMEDQSIDISGFPQGIYFISIISGSGVTCKKFSVFR